MCMSSVCCSFAIIDHSQPDSSEALRAPQLVDAKGHLMIAGSLEVRHLELKEGDTWNSRAADVQTPHLLQNAF